MASAPSTALKACYLRPVATTGKGTMRRTALAIMGLGTALLAPAAWSGPGKLTWDGYGSGKGSKCGGYAMHINVLIDNGRVHGDWQQKGRTVRQFDLALAADGSFAGKVDIGTGSMEVKGTIRPDGGTISLHGYCDFGGALTQG